MELIFNLLQSGSQPTTSNISIWTVIAACAAVLSAVSAFRSRNIAKRSYKLALQIYEDRQSNFTLYLIDGYRISNKQENSTRKYLFFHLTITNKSDTKSSYRAELEIEYVRSDRSVAKVILSHDENLKQYLPQENISVFSNDIRVEEKGIQSKWLVFEQPESILKNFRIEKYTVKVTDTVGSVQTQDYYMMKNFSNENN